MADAARILKLLDLTDLSDSCSADAVDALCAQAAGPHGPVAAVCVWPRFVSRAARALAGTPVRIATVVNFPAGGEDLERAVEDTEGGLRDGATEFDLVMPWRAFLEGRPDPVRTMIAGLRDVLGTHRTLKVILETGALPNAQAIKAAGRLAIAAGADFLKTSTGKVAVGATPEAAEALLAVIRQADRPIGLKVSGGIRTPADAARYLDLVDRVMGPGWAGPATFRIGASGLFDALVAATAGEGSR
jgi:deoxyribose-phosphate aldolase